jgi:hypothetical protein
MVETVEEFADELKEIREEIKEKGRSADVKLVASWLDRLIIALEGITPAVAMMDEEMSVVSEGEGCCECCCGEEMPKAKPKKAAKAKPKKGKKSR